jgi:hypothetical protein
MTRTAFPPHSARGPVLIAVLVAGLGLAFAARAESLLILPSVLCLGVGLGLVVVAAVDRVRAPMPGHRFGRLVQGVLRIPVFLVGVGVVLFGPGMLVWGAWSAYRGHTTAGLSMAVMAAIFTPACVPYGLDALRAASGRVQHAAGR